MIISSHEKNKFAVRNRKDLSIIKIFDHGFGDVHGYGDVRCGLFY